MAKRKPKLSPKEIAEIGLRAIKTHDEEARQIGKEARAISEREEPAKVTRRQELADAAVVTAADVRRFENDNEIVGSNTLMGAGIVDTLENCADVAAFLWYYQLLDKRTEIDSRGESGFSLITQMLLDATVVRGNRLVSEALEIMSSLQQIASTIVGTDPSEDDWYALAVATDQMSMLAMHRLEQALAILTGGEYWTSEHVGKWIGPLATKTPDERAASNG